MEISQNRDCSVLMSTRGPQVQLQLAAMLHLHCTVFKTLANQDISC